MALFNYKSDKFGNYGGSIPSKAQQNEYRLLGDKVIHNYILGMNYEDDGILQDHAYTKVSVT